MIYCLSVSYLETLRNGVCSAIYSYLEDFGIFLIQSNSSGSVSSSSNNSSNSNTPLTSTSSTKIGSTPISIQSIITFLTAIAEKNFIFWVESIKKADKSDPQSKQHINEIIVREVCFLLIKYCTRINIATNLVERSINFICDQFPQVHILEFPKRNF